MTVDDILTSEAATATGTADQAGGDDARCEHQGEHEVRAERDAEQEVGRGADDEQLVALAGANRIGVCLCVHDDFTYVIHGGHDCRNRPNGCLIPAIRGSNRKTASRRSTQMSR